MQGNAGCGREKFKIIHTSLHVWSRSEVGQISWHPPQSQRRSRTLAKLTTSIARVYTLHNGSLIHIDTEPSRKDPPGQILQCLLGRREDQIKRRGKSPPHHILPPPSSLLPSLLASSLPAYYLTRVLSPPSLLHH